MILSTLSSSMYVAVPTVVKRHIQTQRPEVTTYDRFYGKRPTHVTGVTKSLLPDELQQLHRQLPVKGEHHLFYSFLVILSSLF